MEPCGPARRVRIVSVERRKINRRTGPRSYSGFAAQAGDRQAFSVPSSGTSGLFTATCARLLEPADAEDLCQEVFFSLLHGKCPF